MKRLAPILGFIFILIIPATFLMADLGIDLWKPYMSTPRRQDRDESQGAPVCPSFATIFSVEGLYNYYHNLGENKVFLDPYSVYSLSDMIYPKKCPPDEWMTET